MTENRLATTGKQKDRANRLVATIKKLKSLKKSIEKRGKVAPKGCNLLKYQIPQNKKIYWYYKLQAYEPIFDTINGEKKTRYRYLGTAGSEAHIDGVMQVTYRAVIDEIDKMINNLEESHLDVSFGTEIEPDPTFYTEENKPIIVLYLLLKITSPFN
jgi:hypothetical protein